MSKRIKQEPPCSTMAEHHPPPGWKMCPSTGKLVADRFLPFKTPLDDTYNEMILPVHRFGVNDVFRVAEEHGKTIGLWIDLTSIDMFYLPATVSTYNSTYSKIGCSGRNECPNEEQTNEFVEQCSRFFTENPGSLLGVHCTHGFDQTGFLICTFMVQRVDEAICVFAKARPPGILRPDYLRELYQKFSDQDNVPYGPALPDWLFELEVKNDQLAKYGQFYGISSSCVPIVPEKTAEPKFMDGVTGVEFVRDPDVTRIVQAKCQHFSRYRRFMRVPGFPGIHPVSMNQNNMRYLARTGNYRVSLKADGVRYMLLLDGKNGNYFLDRNNNVFQVRGMTFPCHPDSVACLTNTLLDGEMVISVVDHRPLYLLYDVVNFMNVYIGGYDFLQRLEVVENRVWKPREMSNMIDKISEPFCVRPKDYYQIDELTVKKLLSISASRSHDTDGLVFNPIDCAYVADQCNEMLKWKPPTQCTVDFRLRLGEGEDKTRGNLFVGTECEEIFYGELHGNFKDLLPIDGQIVECAFDSVTEKWKLVRVRTDRQFPNSYDTAKSISTVIQHLLTEKLLVDFIAALGCENHTITEEGSAEKV